MKSDSRSNEILRCISKLRVAACAIGIAAVSGLAGCASVDVSSPAAVTSGVVVKRDDFKKLIEYRAPFMQLGFGDGSVYLRGFESTNKDVHKLVAPVTQLSVTLYPRSWMFLDSAYDADGRRLEVKVLNRSVDSCSKYTCLHNEAVAITLPTGYLSTHKDGLRIQVSGKGGSYEVAVPGAYVQGFLTAMTSVK